MNIWIATTGNSDVQLRTEDNWFNLSEEEKLNNKYFEPTSLDVDDEDIYAAPARVLGIVYGQEF
ncbi:MAG: hypothetical protein MGG11_05950 [Trichodesmium sp. MAG_R03]|nr:hypothetical protein [Trichodesmium sp. MAG_R03]